MKKFRALMMLMFAIGFMTNGYCQKMESYLHGTQLIRVGDTLKLEKGSFGGKYSYIFIDQSKMTNNTPLTSQFDGSLVVIKSIKTEKRDKKEVVTATLSGHEPFKTKCYLKEALEKGEMVLVSKHIH